MYQVLKLNEISAVANKAFDEHFELTKTAENPDAIILRSFNMHEYPLGDNLKCVARAGAGTNNIPIDKCTEKGIVVFNTPGANANAVKELVVCAMLLGSRKLVPAVEWVNSLKGKGAEIGPMVEKGKKAFVGGELLGKTLGVIGLGAIGASVANCAHNLGMEVLGYDPYISVDGAWGLSRAVRKCTDLNVLFANCDYITIHVPYLPTTKDTINEDNIQKMKDGVVIINLARGELVNTPAILEGLAAGKVARYVTDFPSDELIGVENVVCFPHLGASTPEAEDNCALAAAKELREFLENGNIRNSVNFPNCECPRSGTDRLTVIHRNVKEMISKITGTIGKTGANISNYVNKAKNDYAYSIIDVDEKIDAALIDALKAIDGVVKVRKL